MNYNTLYHHNTTQGIAEITTRDATGSAGPDTGEAVGKTDIRMLLPSKTVRSISLSQAVPHAQERDSFENSEDKERKSKVVEDQRYFLSDKVQNGSKKTIISSQDSKVCSSIGSKALPKSFKDTTGHNQAQSHIYKKGSSNIYGGVGVEGQLDTVRSWAQHNKYNCKSASMQSERDSVLHPDMIGTGENQMLTNLRESECSRKEPRCDQAKNLSANKDAGTRGQWHFQASAETLLQIRASHLVKLMCIMILVLATFSVVFHLRIKALEEEKRSLLSELGTVKLNVELLVSTMEDIRQAIPPRSQQHLASYEGEDDMRLLNGLEQRNFADRNGRGGKGVERKRIVKRAAVPGRATKGLAYRPDSVTYNSLINGTTGSSFSPNLDEWTVDESRHSKGNASRRHMKNISRREMRRRRQFRKELRGLRTSHRIQIKKIKQKLKQIQQQYRLANLSCCNDSSLPSAHSGCGENPRAVYLQIDGSSVNIKKPRQVIGPWYLPNMGNDIGFNDMWYNGLTLDANGTSVVFQENGLFLISAQVFYQLQHIHDSKPIPMGYRIHLKKNGSENRTFRRPLTIAECVPSFPSTIYQTCFTQVAWYVEALDEVYLEHFTDSRPVIEALRSGQTFLGLVRLH